MSELAKLFQINLTYFFIETILHVVIERIFVLFQKNLIKYDTFIDEINAFSSSEKFNLNLREIHRY